MSCGINQRTTMQALSLLSEFTLAEPHGKAQVCKSAHGYVKESWSRTYIYTPRCIRATSVTVVLQSGCRFRKLPSEERNGPRK